MLIPARCSGATPPAELPSPPPLSSTAGSTAAPLTANSTPLACRRGADRPPLAGGLRARGPTLHDSFPVTTNVSSLVGPPLAAGLRARGPTLHDSFPGCTTVSRIVGPPLAAGLLARGPRSVRGLSVTGPDTWFCVRENHSGINLYASVLSMVE